MSTPTFDFLQAIDTLEAAGIDHNHAAAIAQQLLTVANTSYDKPRHSAQLQELTDLFKHPTASFDSSPSATWSSSQSSSPSNSSDHPHY